MKDQTNVLLEENNKKDNLDLTQSSFRDDDDEDDNDNSSNINYGVKNDIESYRRSFRIPYHPPEEDKKKDENGQSNYNLESNSRLKNKSEDISLFNTSLSSSTLVFKDENPDIKTTLLRSKKFAIRASKKITTYLLGITTFSQFTKPKEIENNINTNLYFLIKDEKEDQFIYDLNDLIDQLKLDNVKQESISYFLNGFNQNILKNDRYIYTKKRNFIYSVLMTTLFFCLLSLLAIFIFLIYKEYDKNKSEDKPFTTTMLIFIIVLLIIGIFFIMQLYLMVKLPVRNKFNLLSVFAENYENNVKYVTDWNFSVFNANHIQVEIPMTIDYILFNKNPQQKIVINSLDCSDIINKFYPNLRKKRAKSTNDVINDKNVINSVSNNISQNISHIDDDIPSAYNSVRFSRKNKNSISLDKNENLV